jgi:hypothetical protein
LAICCRSSKSLRPRSSSCRTRSRRTSKEVSTRARPTFPTWPALTSPALRTVAVAPNGAYVDGDRLRPMKAEFVPAAPSRSEGEHPLIMAFELRPPSQPERLCRGARPASAQRREGARRPLLQVRRVGRTARGCGRASRRAAQRPDRRRGLALAQDYLVRLLCPALAF